MSGVPSELNGVYSMSSILSVTSPPVTLKKAFKLDDVLILAATLISKAVDGFSKFIGFVKYIG